MDWKKIEIRMAVLIQCAPGTQYTFFHTLLPFFLSYFLTMASLSNALIAECLLLLNAGQKMSAAQVELLTAFVAAPAAAPAAAVVDPVVVAAVADAMDAIADAVAAVTETTAPADAAPADAAPADAPAPADAAPVVPEKPKRVRKAKTTKTTEETAETAPEAAPANVSETVEKKPRKAPARKSKTADAPAPAPAAPAPAAPADAPAADAPAAPAAPADAPAAPAADAPAADAPAAANDPLRTHKYRLAAIDAAKCMARKVDEDHPIEGTRPGDDGANTKFYPEKQCNKAAHTNGLCTICAKKYTQVKESADARIVVRGWYGRLDEPLYWNAHVLGCEQFYVKYPNGLKNDPTTAPLTPPAAPAPEKKKAASKKAAGGAGDAPAPAPEKKKATTSKKAAETEATTEWVTFLYEGRPLIRRASTGFVYEVDSKKTKREEMAILDKCLGRWESGAINPYAVPEDADA